MMRNWKLNVAAFIICATLTLRGTIECVAATRMPAVDPTILTEIERRVEQTPVSVAASIKSLAAYLTQMCSTDIAKVRAIYQWIVRNIDYDIAALSSGVLPDQDAEAVLRRRTAVCAGYARLFEALARESGLEAREIIGFSRGAGYSIGSTLGEKPDHAWSAVKIEGQWQLLDCTWAAGYVNAKNEFVRQQCDFYFLTPPELFIYDHFPQDPEWQLIDNKLDKSQYEAMVYARPAFFENGLQFLSHTQGIIKESCCFTMSFGAPRDVLLSAQVIRNEQKDEVSSLFVQREGEEIKINTAFAAPGAYTLRLFTKKATEQRPYDWAADYLIEVEPGSPLPDGFPKALATFHERGVILHSPLSGRLKPGDTVKFKLVAPEAESVAVIIGENWSKLSKNGNTFEGEVMVRGDTVQVAAKYPESESHYVLLKYTVSS